METNTEEADGLAMLKVIIEINEGLITTEEKEVNQSKYTEVVVRSRSGRSKVGYASESLMAYLTCPEGEYCTPKDYDFYALKRKCRKAVDTGNYHYDTSGLVLSYDTDRYFENTDNLTYTEDGYYFENEDELTMIDGNYWKNPPIDLAEYHDECRDDSALHDDNIDIRVGYECEKEDREILIKHGHTYMNENYSFVKESDSSLSSGSGFEFVSPVYDLFGSAIMDDLENYDIADHINADYSSSCGGHMSISKRGVESKELFHNIRYFAPLFVAMYRHRAGNSYSEIKMYNEYSSSRNAFALSGNGRVEIRIFPAIKNVDNLKWRIKLLRLMFEETPRSPLHMLNMMLNKEHPLHLHLRKIYSEEKLRSITKLTMLISSAHGFNGHETDQRAKAVEKMSEINLDSMSAIKMYQ
jgi:hypothetical protein